MLKKFEEFSWEDQLDTDLGVDDFTVEKLVKDIDDIIKSLNWQYNHYSNLCENRTHNPQRDFNKLMDALFAKRWDIFSIKHLFEIRKSEIESELGESNGIVDLFLYYFTNKEFELSGGGQEIQESGWGLGDLIVKYNYGYGSTGKLYLLQNFGNLNAYYNRLAESFIPYFFSNTLNVCESAGLLNYRADSHVQDVNFFKACYEFDLEEREMIINLKKLYKLFDDNKFFKEKIEYQKFIDSIKKDLTTFSMEGVTHISGATMIMTFKKTDFDTANLILKR